MMYLCDMTFAVTENRPAMLELRIVAEIMLCRSSSKLRLFIFDSRNEKVDPYMFVKKFD